jgi:DNA modification methylase
VTAFVQDSDFTLHVGDALNVLAGLPDESVHCVVTSPPYWGLRDYGTGSWDGGDPDCNHAVAQHNSVAATRKSPDGVGGTVFRSGSRYIDQPAPSRVCKCGATRVDQQLGLEATPDLFVQRMVDVFREVRRVLRSDGTCWVNLGDSYAASQGIYPDGSPRLPKTPTTVPQSAAPTRYGDMERGRSKRLSGGQIRVTRDNTWRIKPKDLVGIPWRVAFALQADGWYLRSDIIWSKPNPMPESVTDRPTKAHEYVFLLTKSPRYFFDAEAVREKAEYGRRQWTGDLRSGTQNGDGHRSSTGSTVGGDPSAGRNVRSVWEIATQPYPEAHFATFPEALPERCIKAGTSERGCCPECGAPWARLTQSTPVSDRHPDGRGPAPVYNRDADAKREGFGGEVRRFGYGVQTETIGWRPTCGHFDGEPLELEGHRVLLAPCTVLDPFMGSGTTALVARRLGRRSIGIELNQEYADLCARRLQQLSLFASTPNPVTAPTPTPFGLDMNRPQARRALELVRIHNLTTEHIDALRACGISDTGKALVTTHGTGKNTPDVQALADEARAVLRGYSREFLIRKFPEATDPWGDATDLPQLTVGDA